LQTIVAESLRELGDTAALEYLSMNAWISLFFIFLKKGGLTIPLCLTTFMASATSLGSPMSENRSLDF
jgi:hypothetical protein